ncbi:MAG: type II toxin-antitoxin system RelE/ParE family toxin [Acidobacteria bacterium]|nr:type II toxin-antitoxin system RelE/ParE family toxin [Acidobacteriota bacterium]
MKYIIRKEAHSDLEEIWLYTYETWSIEQADRYINLLLDEVEYLAGNPLLGRNYEHIREGYFCRQAGSHLIFYRFAKNRDLIEIVRMLHKRMNIDTRLR